ncbi:hypothetical protein F4804DRAFT_251377 [Jackrogersella minutella]|nr:hypothetical protein F4804DRAFT_251377 [Jackrogersella minutella]
MRVQNNNESANMEPTTIQRKVTLDSSLPLRALEPQSSQINTGWLISNFGHHKRVEGTIPRTIILEPPYSPISDRSGTSFSQASSADSWEITSTAPSSPQSPRSRQEFDDIPRLDFVPPARESLKRKHNNSTETSKKIKLPSVELPSVHYLLPPANYGGHCFSSKRPFNTPSITPEPRNDHILSNKSAFSPSDDPIVKCLNSWRKKSDGSKSLLSQPHSREGFSLSNTNPGPSDPPPVFYRKKQPYNLQFRGECEQNRQQPSPLREVTKKKGPGCGRDNAHNNIKYLLEETDYIRFNKYEMKLSWEENKLLFRKKFPMADAKMDREKQGIQGVHYRDNSRVPELVDRGRKLVFTSEGHIKAITAKVRDQKENKPYFSLTYLYPERALLYDWVPAKFKTMAAELVMERIPQIEEARRKALSEEQSKSKKDKLKIEECACCPKPDRERDHHKRVDSERDGQIQPSRQPRVRYPTTVMDIVKAEMSTKVYTREQVNADAKHRMIKTENV